MFRVFRQLVVRAVLMVAVVTLFSLLFCLKANACSDIAITDTKGIVVSARTMDFDIDLKSKVKIIPRGQKVTSNAPDGKKGLSWTSRYGYVGVNALGLDKFNDGLNEKGLSIGLLWLGDTEFPKPASSRSALSIHDAGAWILGNFATVEEVKAALKKVTIWGEISADLKMVPPLHMSIHDAEGNNLVVEFVKGEMKMYDNPNGIMTNSPPFDWHLSNIRQNYVNLTDKSASNALGMGNSSFGLPGDSTSPSRFMRLTKLRNFAPKPKSTREAIHFVTYMVNRVTVVPGESKIPEPNPLMPYNGDYTQWTVIRDHVNKVYYYKTLFNSSLRALHLKSLHFDERQPAKSLVMEDDGANWYKDMTIKVE